MHMCWKQRLIPEIHLFVFPFKSLVNGLGACGASSPISIVFMSNAVDPDYCSRTTDHNQHCETHETRNKIRWPIKKTTKSAPWMNWKH